MIQQHFGLKYIPLGKDCPSLWMSDSLSLLKERVISLCQSPGIGLLTGEPGVGKTAALRHITAGLNPHQYPVFYLAETLFTSADVYRQIAQNLGIVPHYRFAQIWRDIKSHIKERVDNKRAVPIFIIDEAQNLSNHFFQGFPSFLNFSFDAKDMMTVWFVGHPILNSIMNRTTNTALASRIQVRHQLLPVIERERFGQLIAHAFAEAGCQVNLLSDSGVELLRVASLGRPRLAHHILVRALELAVKRNLSHLPDDLLQEAITQLKG